MGGGVEQDMIRMHGRKRWEEMKRLLEARTPLERLLDVLAEWFGAVLLVSVLLWGVWAFLAIFGAA